MVSNTTSDAHLLEQSALGNVAAFATLWSRHESAARLAALHLSNHIDEDDVAQEVFANLYEAVRAEGASAFEGPFRQYLYVSVRHVVEEHHNIATSGVLPLAESEAEPAEFTDAVLDSELLSLAFSSLSSEWRTILWYTEVERMTPTEIAPILGLSPNAASALAYRAREGLRAAWLQAHLKAADNASECGWTIGKLGTYTRGALSRRKSERVTAHLEHCASCRGLHGVVNEAASALQSNILPALLSLGVLRFGLGSLLVQAPANATASAALSAVSSAAAAGAGAGAVGIATSSAAGATTITSLVAASSAVAISASVFLVDPAPLNPELHAEADSSANVLSAAPKASLDLGHSAEYPNRELTEFPFHGAIGLRADTPVTVGPGGTTDPTSTTQTHMSPAPTPKPQEQSGALATQPGKPSSHGSSPNQSPVPAPAPTPPSTNEAGPGVGAIPGPPTAWSPGSEGNSEAILPGQTPGGSGDLGLGETVPPDAELGSLAPWAPTDPADPAEDQPVLPMDPDDSGSSGWVMPPPDPPQCEGEGGASAGPESSFITEANASCPDHEVPTETSPPTVWPEDSGNAAVQGNEN